MLFRLPSFGHRFNTIQEYFWKSLRIGWLPILLVIIFVAQNHAFNFWLDIFPTRYLIRRSLVSLALGILLFGPGLLLPKNIKYYYLLMISILVALLFVFQYLYHSYSGGFLQVSALLYIGQSTTLLSAVQALFVYKLLFFILGPVLVVWAWWRERRARQSTVVFTKLEYYATAVAMVFLIIVSYTYVIWRDQTEPNNYVSILHYEKIFDYNALVSKLGIMNFSVGDLISVLARTDEVSAEDISFLNAYNHTEPATTTTMAGNFGIAKGRNLIIVQVESLENAVIETKINGQEITPRLNQFAKDGRYFSNYYSPVGAGTTADAEFAMLNSLYPLFDTVAFIEYAYNHYEALPKLLASSGYHTYSFHGDVSSFWNRANMYPGLGYEQWFDRHDFDIKRKVGPYDLADSDFFEQMIPKLQSLPAPFMATLITLSSHTPFDLPDDLETLVLSNNPKLDWLQQHYLQSVHYVDSAIGDFIDRLILAGLYDKSIIVIVGDHGSFTNIGEAMGVRKSVLPYWQKMQAPMIVLAPGLDLQGVDDRPAGNIDVFPTLANLLGVTPKGKIFGRDLMNSDERSVVMRNPVSGTVNSVVTDKFAFQSTVDGVFERGSCFDLSSKKNTTVENCRTLYERATNDVRASDIAVKGDRITKNY
ncbi:MAG: LTA synthase family protein [Candidatus Magasanikbacteria bacterium]|jgi:phosphoglycerol transferase MdoB-like AlkP superfamily enzyme